jgi:hypothetical protein
VSPVKYEKGFYIPEDTILHSYCREHFKSYMFSFMFEAELIPVFCDAELIKGIGKVQ